LWTQSDSDYILSSLYAISEIMYSLENKIYIDSNSLPSGYLKDQANYCSQIRVCIAKGFMHLILMFLD